VFAAPKSFASALVAQGAHRGRGLGLSAQAGRVEIASIAALGELWGWERSRTSKAIFRWKRAGFIAREEGTDE
jgi:hypothetical protein